MRPGVRCVLSSAGCRQQHVTAPRGEKLPRRDLAVTAAAVIVLILAIAVLMVALWQRRSAAKARCAVVAAWSAPEAKSRGHGLSPLACAPVTA